jgi:hypothetical protein
MLGSRSDIKYCISHQDLKSNFSTTTYLSSQLKKSLYYSTYFNSDHKSTPLSLCSKRSESLIYLSRHPRHPSWRPKPKPKSSPQELKVTPTIPTRKIKPVPSLIHIPPIIKAWMTRLRRCARDPSPPHPFVPFPAPRTDQKLYHTYPTFQAPTTPTTTSASRSTTNDPATTQMHLMTLYRSRRHHGTGG